SPQTGGHTLQSSGQIAQVSAPLQLPSPHTGPGPVPVVAVPAVEVPVVAPPLPVVAPGPPAAAVTELALDGAPPPPAARAPPSPAPPSPPLAPPPPPPLSSPSPSSPKTSLVGDAPEQAASA